MEAARVAAEASDEVLIFFGIIAKWCAFVLEISAKGANSTDTLELQLSYAQHNPAN